MHVFHHILACIRLPARTIPVPEGLLRVGEHCEVSFLVELLSLLDVLGISRHFLELILLETEDVGDTSISLGVWINSVVGKLFTTTIDGPLSWLDTASSQN